MFKSKARKQAEHQLKIEREKQKLLAKQQRQKEQAQAVINATKSLLTTGQISDEYTAIDIAISSAAGLITGGPLGVFLSPAALKMWELFGLRQKGKWIAWGLTGVIAGPVCWSFVVGGDSHKQTAEVAKTDTAIVQNSSTPVVSPSPSPIPSPSPSPVDEMDLESTEAAPIELTRGEYIQLDTENKDPINKGYVKAGTFKYQLLDALLNGDAYVKVQGSKILVYTIETRDCNDGHMTGIAVTRNKYTFDLADKTWIKTAQRGTSKCYDGVKDIGFRPEPAWYLEEEDEINKKEPFTVNLEGDNLTLHGTMPDIPSVYLDINLKMNSQLQAIKEQLVN